MINIDMSKSSPLYIQLRDGIREKILKGELSPGERLPTEEELNRQLNVSVGTIKEALGELVREGLIMRRPKLGTFVRELKDKKTSNMIGVLVSQIDHGMWPTVVKGIEDTAHNAGYRIIVGNTDYTVEKEKIYIDSLLEKNNVAGFIVTLPKYGGKIDNYLKLKKEKGIPIVLMEDHPEQEIDYICVDNVYSGYIATEYLLSLGYKRIGYLGTHLLDEGYTPDRDRLQGYKKALSRQKIEFNERLVIKTDDNFEKGDESEEERVMKFLSRKDRPEAMFVMNDARAKRLYEIARDMGLSEPEDLAIVGHDDMDIGQYLEVPLTTVSPPKYEMGKRAMEIILKKINGDKKLYQELLKPKLIIRDSCGAKLAHTEITKK